MATKTTRKKTAKKPAAKKAARKSTPRTVATKKLLVYASDQESFWVTDGAILNSLQALSEAFDQMEKEVYKYHAAGDQNDFSVWVREVLCDEECAVALEAATTPKKAKTVVVRSLKKYQ